MDEIIKAAIVSPSADNIQPWRFRIGEEKIDIIFKKDEYYASGYHNINHFADYISIGAAIENIVQAGLAKGLDAHIDYFPNEVIAASITFKKTDANKNYFNQIFARRTNRKKYLKEKINPDILTEAKKIVQESGFELDFIEGKDLKQFAGVLSLFDLILWQNDEIREKLLEHLIIFEDPERRSGISLNALELGFRKHFFKLSVVLASHFPFLWKTISMNSSILTKSLVKNSGAIFLLSSSGGMTEENFVKGGRVFEKLWLFLTEKGISMQPIFGSLDLWLNSRLKLGSFSGKEEEIQKKICKLLDQNFPALESNIPIALGRIGYSKKAKYSSPRMSAEELLSV